MSTIVARSVDGGWVVWVPTHPEGIFYGAEVLDELGRQVGLRDVLVVRGELVPMAADVADPELRPSVDAAKGVEDRAAGRLLAHDRVVGNRREIRSLLQRGE